MIYIIDKLPSSFYDDHVTGRKQAKGGRKMFSKCPGQDSRNLRVELHKCPNCGGEVEIFSDETRVKCQKCGTMVFKERMPSCIEWCASARQCLGEERWKALVGDVRSETHAVKIGGGKTNACENRT